MEVDKLRNMPHLHGRTFLSDAASGEHRQYRRPERRPTPIAAGYRLCFGAFLAGADLLTFGFAAWLAVPHAVGKDASVTFCLLLGVVCLQLSGSRFGAYDTRTSGQLRAACAPVVFFGVAASLLIRLLVYGAGGAVVLPTALSNCAVAITSACLLRLVAASLLEHYRDVLAARCVLVASGATAAHLLSQRGGYVGGESVVGWIAVGTGEAPWQPMLGFDADRDDRASIARDSCRISAALQACTVRLDRVLVAVDGFGAAELSSVLSRLDPLSFEIGLIPPSSPMTSSPNASPRDQYVTLRPAAMTTWELLWKRALDITVASALLVVTAPLMVLIAVLIRRESPGPALFMQVRSGLNNQPFRVYKFRTMWVSAAGSDGTVQATRGDRRVTPIGAFLRRNSLDELPQLLNVLNGTMSLVGPRPHPVELNARFLGLIEHFPSRHRVLPGITGLAQVSGCRGETSTLSAMQRRVELDLEYISNRSISVDLWILFKTAVSLFQRGDVY